MMRPSWLDTLNLPMQWVGRLPQLQRHYMTSLLRIVNGQNCAVDQLCVRLAERWFAMLTEKQIRRGSHRSTRELEDALRLFVAIHNGNPKPLVWVKTADQILASIRRFCQ